ncbi:MAG: PAS-domain containing protein, partial [Bradyrhizobium sp.]
MAGKTWQAGSKDLIPARAVVCLAAVALSCTPAWAAFGQFAPASYLGALDPNVLWEVLIGGIVVCAFLAAVAFWIHSALRRVKRSQMRRNAYISSALNSLSHGVVMTDGKNRVVYCNDRYLQIYGMQRADLPAGITGAQLLELRFQRGVLDCTPADFYLHARSSEGLVTQLPDGRSIMVRHFVLPNGGSIATHEDSTEQRELSRELASTKQFLESVLDNVPVCVAAKNIQDGRYIFANRAFERFSRFSRDHIVGKRADEIFRP